MKIPGKAPKPIIENDPVTGGGAEGDLALNGIHGAANGNFGNRRYGISVTDPDSGANAFVGVGPDASDLPPDSYNGRRFGVRLLIDDQVKEIGIGPKVDVPTSAKEPRKPSRIFGNWNRTIRVGERLADNPLYEEPDEEHPNGLFAGRQIIGRDQPINGGVYLGGHTREAIVVDDSKIKGYEKVYGKIYDELVTDIYGRVEQNPGGSVLDNILKPTFDAVMQAMPYNAYAVEQLAYEHPDRKINLGRYIDDRVGVCRHQALLVGYLLERLQSNQELVPEDSISVDRNAIPGVGGHAWVRYTASDGTVYILDPAQRKVDKLENLHYEDGDWDYRRLEDVANLS